jgi:predicted RecB family nuclease
MFLLSDGGDDLVISASDLRAASECEFALLRTLDEKLGRLPVAERADDPVMRRAAELGERHEAQELARRVAAFGRTAGAALGVYEVARPASYTRANLEAAHCETFDALRAGHPVVFQACFFDGGFHGFADFLIRVDDGLGIGGPDGTPKYAVADTKLARTTRVPALLQIAAYADQLTRGGIATHDQAELILGDNTTHFYPLADIVPVFRERWERLNYVMGEHRREGGAVGWNDPRYLTCGRCDACAAEASANRDLLMVAGMRVSQRKKLRAQGIETIDDLAASTGPVDDISARSLEATRAQARLQVRSEQAVDGDVQYEVYDSSALQVLPQPSPGDIFFDFEGDPMWSVPGDRPGPGDWGLEYLFGVMEAGGDDTFRPFWAHSRAAEKVALEDFVDHVTERRATYPDLHIYHYAAYEKAALTRLAARHGTREDDVDGLLRAGVLVDLYSVVRNAVRVSADSYSIKSLEPLYMGDRLRTGEVTNAGDSIVEYASYCLARDLGDGAKAASLLAGIADYNQYDCLSTLRLRDWLLERAAEHGVALKGGLRDDQGPTESTHPDEVEVRLWELSGPASAADRNPDQQAYAMMAASLGYNAREHKPFWWGHFDRLTNPVDEWVDGRDVFVAQSAEVVVPWERPTSRSQPHRQTRLVGRFGTGSVVGEGSTLQAIYDPPVPAPIQLPDGTLRGFKGGAKIVGRGLAAAGDEYVVVDETLRRDADEYDQLPMALAPNAPPFTASIDAALHHLGETVLGGFPQQAGLDLLRLRPPRLADGQRLPRPGSGPDGYVDAIHDAVRSLDSSYLAVQGPPGTGKTYVGAHVVRRLVEQEHWRIGVVAQSHAVIENFLDCIVESGLAPELVGKKSRDKDASPSWTVLDENGYASFLVDHAGSGCVLGGTSWDFTNESRVTRGELDLLVIDEAGQFALAWTLAVSVAARRLLLLGDPQQLPQVIQGCHPEPVDQSALGWLIEGHATLPADRGYFLEHSWRMHPNICSKVSTLAYDGQLRSRERVTRSRSLEGIEPGVEVIMVDHRDNSVESPEEAAEVVQQVRALIGRRWSDPRDESTPRPLSQQDIRVVAPYNAQVNCIRDRLIAAGYADVPVGSVDRFQGQEAAVVIVSMTASARGEVPRGMGFLLNRNRVNVSVSRGQWKSIIIRSTVLTDFSPSTPHELLELGAFIGLCSPGG